MGVKLTFKTPENWMKGYPKRGSAGVRVKSSGSAGPLLRMVKSLLWSHPGYRREALMGQAEDRLLRTLNLAMLRDLGLFKGR